jgi:hypothetical protein
MNEPKTPHLPPPSIWPFGFAVGVACLLTGLVVSDVVAIVGGVIALAFGLLWIRDVTRPVRAPAEPVEPERRVAMPTVAAAADDEEEDHAYSRSVFLGAATLGLGGIIGGLVTVPALGFAVLPSFTNVEEPSPDLGPLDAYPEGEWVIATYLEDEEIGEVTPSRITRCRGGRCTSATTAAPRRRASRASRSSTRAARTWAARCSRTGRSSTRTRRSSTTASR